MKGTKKATMEEVKSEFVTSAISQAIELKARHVEGKKNTFEALIPVSQPKTLAEMEVAIMQGLGVGEVADLRLCKQVERVHRDEMYKGSYSTFEKWATSFKALNVTNRQAAYLYVNRAKLIADDCLSSVFIGRRNERLVFTLTQLDAIYKAIKEKGVDGDEVTASGIEKAQKLISDGVKASHFTTKTYGVIKGDKDFSLFITEEKNGEVVTPVIHLSPAMKTRVMQAFLSEALKTAEELKKEAEEREAKKKAKEEPETETDETPETAGQKILLNGVELRTIVHALAHYGNVIHEEAEEAEESKHAIALATRLNDFMVQQGYLPALKNAGEKPENVEA